MYHRFSFCQKWPNLCLKVHRINVFSVGSIFHYQKDIQLFFLQKSEMESWRTKLFQKMKKTNNHTPRQFWWKMTTCWQPSIMLLWYTQTTWQPTTIQKSPIWRSFLSVREACCQPLNLADSGLFSLARVNYTAWKKTSI